MIRDTEYDIAEQNEGSTHDSISWMESETNEHSCAFFSSLTSQRGSLVSENNLIKHVYVFARQVK